MFSDFEQAALTFPIRELLISKCSYFAGEFTMLYSAETVEKCKEEWYSGVKAKITGKKIQRRKDKQQRAAELREQDSLIMFLERNLLKGKEEIRMCDVGNPNRNS